MIIASRFSEARRSFRSVPRRQCSRLPAGSSRYQDSPRPLSASASNATPTLAEQLRGAHPAVIPGYHLNKRHWNTVIIDGSLPDAMIADMVEDSYDLVVSKLPRARRRALAWRGDA